MSGRMEIDANVAVPAEVIALLESVGSQLEEGCLKVSFYSNRDRGAGLDADLLLDDSPMAWVANGLHSHVTATWNDEPRTKAWPDVVDTLKLGIAPCTDPDCEYPHHAE